MSLHNKVDIFYLGLSFCESSIYKDKKVVRQNISGVYIEVKDGIITFASTDSHRVATISFVFDGLSIQGVDSCVNNFILNSDKVKQEISIRKTNPTDVLTVGKNDIINREFVNYKKVLDEIKGGICTADNHANLFNPKYLLDAMKSFNALKKEYESRLVSEYEKDKLDHPFSIKLYSGLENKPSLICGSFLNKDVLKECTIVVTPIRS
jgi:DNA polymerase III sliding clamp (beta) subunit (PCNA family)